MFPDVRLWTGFGWSQEFQGCQWTQWFEYATYEKSKIGIPKNSEDA